MTNTRAWHTATLIDSAQQGYVLLVGGDGNGADTYEIWNRNIGTVSTGNLADGRWRHTATTIRDVDGTRDKVVIAGGENSTDVVATLEIFDLTPPSPSMDPVVIPMCATAEDQLAGLPGKPKTMHTAVYVPGRKYIYFAGGFDNISHTSPTDDICVWLVGTEEFKATPANFKLNVPRGAHAAIVLEGNEVLLSGGMTLDDFKMTATGTFEVIFEYLNSDNQMIIDVGKPQLTLYPRFDQKVVKTSDQRVLMVGGIKENVGVFGVERSAEVFNP